MPNVNILPASIINPFFLFSFAIISRFSISPFTSFILSSLFVFTMYTSYCFNLSSSNIAFFRHTEISFIPITGKNHNCVNGIRLCVSLTIVLTLVNIDKSFVLKLTSFLSPLINCNTFFTSLLYTNCFFFIVNNVSILKPYFDSAISFFIISHR